MPDTLQTPTTPPQSAGTAEGAPDEAFGATTTTVEVNGGPQLAPPEDTAAVAEGEGVAAWLNDRKVVGVWSNSSNKNSWVNIQGIGWRRLHPGADSAVVAMTLLAGHARAAGRNVNVRIEADNTVHEIYVW